MKPAAPFALAATLVVLATSVATAQPYDHLKCYKMRDTQTFSSANADIETIEASFGLQNCRIKKKAKQICIPATKDVTAITDGTDTPFPVPTDDLAFEQICYKITCPRVTIAPQTVSDQFGTRTVDGLKASTLCVPAVFGPAPTTTTTSTTSTSTTTTTLVGSATWSIRAGDAAAQNGIAIGVDGAGNVIAAGNFAGSIDFGLGAMMSAGSSDIFVVKLDPFGVPIWNKRFGDASDQNAFDVAIDADDDIVLVGTFGGSVDFGGGPISSSGGNDAYVTILDENGNHVSSRGFGGSASEGAFNAEIDSAGDILVVGSFGSASVNFGGGGVAVAGTTDCYIARYDDTGAWISQQTFGGVGATCFSTGVDSDPMGSVVIAASISGSVDFGGGALMSAGSIDAVVAKFDYLGAHVWSKRFGDASLQQAVAVVVGTTGIAVTGNAAGTIDFGGGPLTSAGANDVFFASLDGAGAHQWSHIHGDPAAQSAVDVVADSSGNLNASGQFQGAIDLGGGSVASLGGNDGYLVKYTGSGAYVSSVIVADTGEQTVTRLAVDGAGNRYVTGSFAGTIDLGDGAMMSGGTTDVFIAKLAP